MRAHLASLLDDFRRFDRQIAIVRTVGVRRRATSYAELARTAGRFAAWLAARNIGPGDRVVLWAENSAEWVAAFYGILLRGALAVPLDAYGSVDFASRVAADVRPALIVGDALLLQRLPDTWPRLAFDDWPASLPAEEASPVPGLNHETPLQILFTSGTTGEPKGIVHTHGNVLASVGPIERDAQPYMRYEKYVHPLRFLHTLPLSHVFGQTMGLWVPAIFAAEVHFESRLVAPRLVETIRRERISVLAAVPRVMALLRTHLDATHPDLAARVAATKGMKAWQRWWAFRDIHRLFGLKFWALISGGGALGGPLESFWNSLGFVVVQGYGMTETTALITLNHPFRVAQGTIGKPLPGREVKIGPDGEVLVRGPMISTATWQGGQLQQRADDWLATGDLAEQQETGELRFLGRKSETIVTAAGVNIHPEDLEAAIEQEPFVAACAVVPVETANGPEPCAVLAMRGGPEQAAAAIESANTRLAEFQRVRRWFLWPEPDLPRTSTGKVRRKPVAAWLASVQDANGSASATHEAAHTDWLLAQIAEITGEAPPGAADALRLSEDLHLDSLGRVQLAAALEQRLGTLPAEPGIESLRTLGDLRALVSSGEHRPAGFAASGPQPATGSAPMSTPLQPGIASADSASTAPSKPPIAEPAEEHIYPHWPWWRPITWLRTVFQECLARPLTWLLAAPRVTGSGPSPASEPFLIIANHVSTFDGPLVLYALPGPMRRRVAAAMSGEMLLDYRHFRNADRLPGQRERMWFGPLAWLLLTALYNVFPLPRGKGFQRSFAHAGHALDRGYNVLVFPEGTRSATGTLARFRPGIGILVKQTGAAVLPVALSGLGELKVQERGWFRSGKIEIRIGAPLRFGPAATETEITASLHGAVDALLNGRPAPSQLDPKEAR
ncbi:MAG: AMP-binding protein [Acidobacteriota bacterium]|nr:AMP-binding protein [Acidobacteriota bacterium]